MRLRTNFLQLLTYAALSTSALVIPLYARDLGASFELIGLIGTAHGAAGVLSNFAFGRLGDRTDRRNLLAFGFLAAALAYGAQFLARTPETLLAARFLVGFAAGAVPATLVAYVYDVRRPLGKFTSYNAIGWLAGSFLIIAVGALTTYAFANAVLERARQSVLEVGPFGLLFLGSGLFCLVGWILARRLPSMHVHLDVPLFPARVITNNLHVYLSILLRHLGATAIWTVYPLYVVSLGGNLAMVGWVHVVNMIAQIALLRSSDRIRFLGSPRVLITSGLFLSALVFYLFTLARTDEHLLWMQLLVGLSFGALWLGCLKEVLEHNVERATATGLLNASISLSNVLGPLAGGLIMARYGFHVVMYAGAAVTLLALVLFFVLGRLRPARQPVAPQLAPRAIGEIAP